jgi:alpha-L-rhamnosidase
METVTLTPAGLRCAHLTDPLSIAPDRVRFSWRLEGGGSDSMQAGYQVQVTHDPARQPSDATVAWDSGRVASSSCSDIGYDGAALRRGDRYTWRVRIWDSAGAASPWSSPASFEVELDPASGWHASWIGLDPAGPSGPADKALQPAPYLRRTFTLAEPPASARLYITALGLYEARLNGARVGDAYLTPGWTDYRQRLLYQAYDVTLLLRPGENALGAIIADGWYAGFVGFDEKRPRAHYGSAPELLAQLVIMSAAGEETVMATDAQWQGRYAAIRHADLLMGERQDLRLCPEGWDQPGFTADEWRPVLCRPRDDRPLSADPGPPVRVAESRRPASIAARGDGRFLVDFGQNLTGWVQLRGAGPAGGVVRVRHGEILDAAGGLYTENLRTARQLDEFTLAGTAAVLEPRFTVHGFRYAEIDAPAPPQDVVARVAHSAIEATGSFECSEPWLEQLFRTIDWGQRGNFINIPTDCPQRDERLGWLGDAQVFARTACYNRDVAAFFAKWIDDVGDAQLPSGAFSDIAPRLHLEWAAAPAWGDAGVIVPWTVWKMYGDTSVLRRHYAAMTAWMEFIERDNPSYLRTRNLGNSYNDWLAPGGDNTPPGLLATAYWAYDATLMAQIAQAAGQPADAARYRATAAKIRSAFISAYVSSDGEVSSGTQTAYTLALHMGLVPAHWQEQAAARLVDAIRAADWHLTTGFAGIGYLLPVLSSHGHDDVAYRLLSQQGMPSWRYMLDNGATTIWERWDSIQPGGGFETAWMNSFNHYSLGSVGEWLYRYLLGIDQEPGSAGFGRLLLHPRPGRPLTWARGRYDSVRGPVSCSWAVTGDSFTYEVSLPPNVTATVRVPAADASAVRDGTGQPPTAVSIPGNGPQEAEFLAGPGTHQFAGPAPFLTARRPVSCTGFAVRPFTEHRSRARRDHVTQTGEGHDWQQPRTGDLAGKVRVHGHLPQDGRGSRHRDLDRPARRRPGRRLDLLGLRQGQAATEQPERDTAAERRPGPGQGRHHAGGRHR